MSSRGVSRQAISSRRQTFLSYIGTDAAKGDRFGERQLKLWDDVDRDYEGARMEQMTPHKLKVMTYVCTVYSGELRLKLMEYVTSCKLEKKDTNN